MVGPNLKDVVIVGFSVTVGHRIVSEARVVTAKVVLVAQQKHSKTSSGLYFYAIRCTLALLFLAEASSSSSLL